MGKFIELNHTLLEYTKKYRNRYDSLLKVTKKVVEDYEKKNPTMPKNYLLRGRKWWLIEDTYYEIPKAPRWTWFRNLNGALQIGTCALLGVAIASIVAIPTVLYLNSLINVEVEETVKSSVEIKEKKYVGDNFEITLSLKDDDKKFTDEITVKIGDTTLKPEDYTFDKTTGKLTIKKSVIDANEGKSIVVKPTIKDKIYVTKIECINTITLNVGEEIPFDDLHVTITPNDADDKSYKVLEGDEKSKEFIEINQASKKIKGLKAGESTVVLTANGANPKSPCESAVCKITVKNVYATGITSDAKKVMGINKEISFDDLNVKITPEDTTIKTFTVTDISETNESCIQIDQTNRKIKSTKEGTGKIKIEADGSDPASAEKPSTTCVISVNQYEPVDFATCSWSELSERCNKFEKEVKEDKFCEMFTFDGKFPSKISDFVGKERKVTVNGQEHIVRVIDTLHDVASDDTKLALTFEFANLISDSNGYSLAYQWYDDGDNKDYINSTIRHALTGEGNNGGKDKGVVLAAVKGGVNWDNVYKDKTILSMLPKELSDVLKTTKKSVGIYDGEYEEGKDYDKKEYNDKLFMLSAKELGYVNSNDRGFGDTYSYYAKATEKTDPSRIKKQVNILDKCDDCSIIPYDSESGHKSVNPVFNYAGYNDNGGYYWQRSPIYLVKTTLKGEKKLNPYYAYAINEEGSFGNGYGCAAAYGVAPAFCI